MLASSAIARWLEGMRVARERARTQKIIGSLPPELRKDIGWPDRFSRHDGTMGPFRR